MNRTLISTDKNGTKLFHCTSRCFKCGGTGIISYYIPVNGGECFDCNGSGITEWTEKEYTPEYEAKLEARRQRRQERKLMAAKAQAKELNEEFFRNNGFNPEGKTYFILGNTFSIKEELKEAGAKFDGYSRHWHMNHIPENLPYLEVSIEDLYFTDEAGVYNWRNQKVDGNIIESLDKAESNLQPESEYIGNEGDKITVKVTYLHTSSFESIYGYNRSTYIHSFKDESGNMIIWKTSNNLPYREGESLTITGTIKGYKDYKGSKQTILTRCSLN